jgi:hypothetical protein
MESTFIFSSTARSGIMVVAGLQVERFSRHGRFRFREAPSRPYGVRRKEHHAGVGLRLSALVCHSANFGSRVARDAIAGRLIIRRPPSIEAQCEFRDQLIGSMFPSKPAIRRRAAPSSPCPIANQEFFVIRGNSL